MDTVRNRHDDDLISLPAFALFWLAVFLRIILGNDFLNLFISYSLEGGYFYEKIHPSIHLLFPVALLILLQGKVADLVRLCWRDVNAVFLYLVVTLVISLLSVALRGTDGMAYLSDTHISAAAFGMIAYACSPRQKKLLKNTILMLILINSIVAIGEFVFQQHLISYLQHEHMPSFRSSAFFGHPLKNSLITVTAMFFIFTTSWTTKMKMICTACYGISLLCYGGRMASIILLLSIAVFIVIMFFRDFQQRTKFLEISLFIFGVPLAVLLLYVLITDFGIGARMFERELFDTSGMARISLFGIFSHLSMDKLLMGMSLSEISRLTVSVFGFRTIENFWVMIILLMGLPAALLIALSLLRMLFQLNIHQETAARLGTASFLLVASSNNSLATKSFSLTVVVLLLVTSLTPPLEAGPEDMEG